MQHPVLLSVAAVVFAVSAATVATPAAAGTFDLDVTVTAVHTRAWARRSLNQFNPGLGVEYHVSRTWGVMAGEYKNSYRRPTWYAAATWTPLHLGRDDGWRVDAGLGAGLASGYTRRQNPAAPAMAAGIVRFRTPRGWGVNLLWVPNQPDGGCGFVGLQLAAAL